MNSGHLLCKLNTLPKEPSLVSFPY
jgi:hypothetical protein